MKAGDGLMAGDSRLATEYHSTVVAMKAGDGLFVLKRSYCEKYSLLRINFWDLIFGSCLDF